MKKNKRKYSVKDPKYPMGQLQYNIFRYTKKYNVINKILFYLLAYANNDQLPNIFKLKNIIKILTHGIRDQYIFSPKIDQLPNNYLRFKDKSYYEIDYGRNTRSCILTNLGETIQTNIQSKEYDKLILGIALLKENNKSVQGNELHLELSLNEANYSIKIPTDEYDHLPHWKEVISNPIGANWLSLTLDLNKNNNSQKFKLRGQLLKKEKSESTKIAIGTPKLVKKRRIEEKKNIICLIGESFVDPDLFRVKYDLKLNTPNLDQLKDESHNYKMAYSQSNWTLPYISSMLTGLYPSQHNYTTRDPVEQRLGLNNELKHISEILRDNDYYTIGNFTQVSWYPDCGWAKGFDEYKFVPRKWSNDAVNINWVIDTLNIHDYQDLAIFVHFDRLHRPYVCLDQYPTTSNIDLKTLDILNSGNKIPIIKHQIEALDKEIGVLIAYLKNTKQFDNTMLIVSGDHGISPSNWKKGLPYSDFEEMIRVPLIIKYPTGDSKVIESPVNANTSIFHKILEEKNIPLPEYFNEYLNNSYISYKGCAVTETIRRPNENSHSISLTNQNFRYWLQTEIDLVELSINNIIDEKLFKVDNQTFNVDESLDLADKYPSETDIFRDIAIEFLKYNFDFQKKYPLQSNQ
jgi:hypothetical protein